jgi:hypothetical protein
MSRFGGIRRFRSGDRRGAFGYRCRFRSDETSVAIVLIDVSKASKSEHKSEVRNASP